MIIDIEIGWNVKETRSVQLCIFYEIRDIKYT